MRDPEFRQRVDALEQELLDEARRQRFGAMRRLAELRGKAIDRLEQLVASENETVAFKASEALCKFDGTVGAAVLQEALIAERLTRLEKALGLNTDEALA